MDNKYFESEYKALQKSGTKAIRPHKELDSRLHHQADVIARRKSIQDIYGDWRFMQDVSTDVDEIPKLLLAMHRYLNKDFIGSIQGLSRTNRELYEKVKDLLDFEVVPAKYPRSKFLCIQLIN